MLLNHSCTKQQFAQYAGVSTSTLKRWLKQHEQTIANFGQKVHDKVLLPQTVQFLAAYYEVTDDKV